MLDTNILILILASQGKFDLLSLYKVYDEVLVSIVTQVEALGFQFTVAAEEEVMSLYIQDLLVLPFTQAEAQHAIAYRKLKKSSFPARPSSLRPTPPGPTC